MTEENMAEEKKTTNGFWPNTKTLEGARSAAKQGVWAACFVAAVTLAVAIYSLFAEAVLGIDMWALVDVFLFGAIAFGIWKMSRFAAVAGLLLYLAERVWMYQTNGQTGGIVAILLILMFINSIRGTVAHHRIKSGNEQPDLTQPPIE